jgi:hypothetical protein
MVNQNIVSRVVQAAILKPVFLYEYILFIQHTGIYYRPHRGKDDSLGHSSTKKTVLQVSVHCLS